MTQKYIIEIEEEPLVRKSCLHGEDAVYRASGFKSLVFDQNGLDRLKPLSEYCGSECKEYARGMENAWNAAERIACMNERDILGVFRKCYYSANTKGQVFQKYTAQEAIEVLNEHSEDKKTDQELSVGDEIEWEDGTKAVVLDIDSEDSFYQLNENGCVNKASISEYDYLKTGRIHNVVPWLIDKLRKEEA